MSDPLDDAFAALREETNGASDDAAATRRKILLRATTKRKQRSVVVRFLLPIAAVLALGTAWAAATGRLPRAVRATTSLLFGEEDRAPKSSAPGDPRSAGAVTALPDTIPDAGDAPSTPNVGPDTAAPTSTPNAAIAASSTTGTPNGATNTATPNAAPSSSSRGTRPPKADVEDSLYRTAHEAHFAQHDSPRALAAWDAYLAAYPHGRFAPEARYNRAITLVRLGEVHEAREALVPFANGAYGEYRRSEAQKLIDALP